MVLGTSIRKPAEGIELRKGSIVNICQQEIKMSTFQDSKMSLGGSRNGCLSHHVYQFVSANCSGFITSTDSPRR